MKPAFKTFALLEVSCKYLSPRHTKNLHYFENLHLILDFLCGVEMLLCQMKLFVVLGLWSELGFGNKLYILYFVSRCFTVIKT